MLAVLLVSCHQNQNQAEQVVRPLAPSSDKAKRAHQPTEPIAHVEDLLPVHGDTLIAVMQFRLALTTDAGRHWHDLPRSKSMPLIKRLAIDQHHTLWGLDWWPGVHEAPYARLSYSTDFGHTWADSHEFDPETFFPYAFYSPPGHPIQMLTRGEEKLYQMQDRAGRQWAFIRSLADPDRKPYTFEEPTLLPVERVAADTSAAATYFAAGRFKFLTTGQLFARSTKGWQFAARVGGLNELDDVCPCQGSIYLTGRNREVDQTLSLVQIAKDRKSVV